MPALKIEGRKCPSCKSIAPRSIIVFGTTEICECGSENYSDVRGFIDDKWIYLDKNNNEIPEYEDE